MNLLIPPDERFFPRTRDRLHRLISTSNLNVSKQVFEFILNDYLKRRAGDITISDFDKARSRARRIIFGFKVNCHDRREFNWSDIMSCFKIGKFLYQVLSLVSNDLGYKSLFTYNLTLFHSYMNEFNPLTYQVLKCSPLYPGLSLQRSRSEDGGMFSWINIKCILFFIFMVWFTCFPGALAWSLYFLYITMFLCNFQPIFSRTLENWHTFSYRECTEVLRQSVQQKWNNFSFDKKIPLVPAISCCKAILITFWIYRNFFFGLFYLYLAQTKERSVFI